MTLTEKPLITASNPEERLLAREVETWLWEQSLPDGVVLWFPHWLRQHAVEVAHATHLEGLIAGLEVGDWGGIRTAGAGRWAQAKHALDGASILELHPYAHDRPSLPFVWQTFTGLSAGQAAPRAWRWVATNGSENVTRWRIETRSL
jgi:hypothetical protein